MPTITLEKALHRLLRAGPSYLIEIRDSTEAYDDDGGVFHCHPLPFRVSGASRQDLIAYDCADVAYARFSTWWDDNRDAARSRFERHVAGLRRFAAAVGASVEVGEEPDVHGLTQKVICRAPSAMVAKILWWQGDVNFGGDFVDTDVGWDG